MNDATSLWFPSWAATSRSSAALSLFCLPHAGAGPTAYRDWTAGLDEQLDIIPVQYPGRAARVGESSETSIRHLAERIADPFLERAGARPFALFGHSMGALVAFELARVLTANGTPPRHLFVSGQTAPHRYPKGTVHQMSDEDFVRHVVDLEGTDPDVLASPTLLEMLLPILRADYLACETYEFAGEPDLSVDLSVLCGEADPTVRIDELGRWSELSTGHTQLRTFSGGHFYFTDHLAEVLDIINNALCPLETA
ncbi:MAG TPA: alpha/beta fold hydrolase [Pseudonocardiaceae bacterium]|jgi:surfactin synthase thioesterase subunit